MIKARRYETLIGHWNNSVNLAHNGGWWFNKLLYKADFDRMGDDFATQLHIIPELVSTTEWIEQIQEEILRQKAHPCKIATMPNHPERIIKRFLSSSSLQIVSLINEAIKHDEWKYEEFGEEARWRFTDVGNIKLQFMYNSQRYSLVLNINDEMIRQLKSYIANQQIFTLQSLAGTNVFYAPATVYINKQQDYKGHRVVFRVCVGSGSVTLVADSKW
jgi:hypothetical protein